MLGTAGSDWTLVVVVVEDVWLLELGGKCQACHGTPCSHGMAQREESVRHATEHPTSQNGPKGGECQACLWTSYSHGVVQREERARHATELPIVTEWPRQQWIVKSGRHVFGFPVWWERQYENTSPFRLPQCNLLCDLWHRSAGDIWKKKVFLVVILRKLEYE